MALFEKIELEPVEQEEHGGLSRSSRRWRDETLTVVYPLWKRGMILLMSLIVLPIAQAILDEGILAFEMATFVALLITVWYLGNSLLTSDITFTPDGIVRNSLFGRTVLPGDALVMTVSDLSIRFVHGTEKNIREAVRVHRFIVTTAESEEILAYVEDVYGASAGKSPRAGKKPRGSTRALDEYGNSVDAYRTMAALFVVFALIAFFAVALPDNFSGFGHELPSFPVRLACIVLALGSFLLLRRLAPTPARLEGMKLELIGVRLKKLDNAAFASAAVATCVAGLGLLLLFIFGNMLDFYLFLLVGVLYFHDCYPRLSTWQRVAGGTAAEGEGETSLLPRRSLQVSVVLMGALALLSYGESSHYLYASRKDCLEDWGDSRDCREATSGGGGGGGGSYSGRYYGPRYGSGGGRATRAIGIGSVSRGGFGSLGSFHASFGG